MGNERPDRPIFVGGRRRRRPSARALALIVLILAVIGLLIYGMTTA